MRGLVDNIPMAKLVGQVSEISLLLLPVVVLADLLAGTDDGQGRVAILDGAAAGHVALGQRLGHQVLLQLGEDVFSRLVGRLAPDAVLLVAALEQGAGDAVEAQRRQDAAEPEEEAAVRGADEAQQVLVEGVEQDEPLDGVAVAGREDARVDGAHAGADEDPGAVLARAGQGLADGLDDHAGGRGGGRRVAPGEARAVDVAVPADGAVVDGGVGELPEAVLDGAVGLKEHRGQLGALGVGRVALAKDVQVVLVVVNGVQLAGRGQAGVEGAEDQGAGHEQEDHVEDGHGNGRDEHRGPFAQAASGFCPSGQPFLLFILSPENEAIRGKDPDGNEESPCIQKRSAH